MAALHRDDLAIPCTRHCAHDTLVKRNTPVPRRTFTKRRENVAVEGPQACAPCPPTAPPAPPPPPPTHRPSDAEVLRALDMGQVRQRVSSLRASMMGYSCDTESNNSDWSSTTSSEFDDGPDTTPASRPIPVPGRHHADADADAAPITGSHDDTPLDNTSLAIATIAKLLHDHLEHQYRLRNRIIPDPPPPPSTEALNRASRARPSVNPRHRHGEAYARIRRPTEPATPGSTRRVPHRRRRLRRHAIPPRSASSTAAPADHPVTRAADLDPDTRAMMINLGIDIEASIAAQRAHEDTRPPASVQSMVLQSMDDDDDGDDDDDDDDSASYYSDDTFPVFQPHDALDFSGSIDLIDARRSNLVPVEEVNIMVQCSICYDDVDPLQAYSLTNCEHKFCIECLSSYVRVQVMEMGNVQHLRCPGIDCNSEHIDQAVFDRVTTEEIRGKYHQWKSLRDDPNNTTCPKCDTIVRRKTKWGGTKWKKNVVCSECEHKFCFKHGDAHVGSTCRAYNSRNGESGNRQWKKKHAKKCPKCKVPVEKSSGCNHMECPCGAAWCWLCSKHLKTKVYSHWSSSNLFGCPGGQMTGGKHARAKIRAKKVGIVAGGMGLVAISPVILAGAIIASPFYVTAKVYKAVKRRYRRR